MNIKEVYMLSRNPREFYRGSPYPYLPIQTGNHAWFYHEREIPERITYTPQQLSEWLFDWVFE